MAILYAFCEEAVARAAEAALPFVNPVAGITIPVGRRAVFHNMVMSSQRTTYVTVWLCRTAIGIANHLQELTIPLAGGSAGGDIYVYVDATAAAVVVLLSHIGNNGTSTTCMLSGMLA
jgi:hypothetical protein